MAIDKKTAKILDKSISENVILLYNINLSYFSQNSKIK